MLSLFIHQGHDTLLNVVLNKKVLANFGNDIDQCIAYSVNVVFHG